MREAGVYLCCLSENSLLRYDPITCGQRILEPTQHQLAHAVCIRSMQKYKCKVQASKYSSLCSFIVISRTLPTHIHHDMNSPTVALTAACGPRSLTSLSKVSGTFNRLLLSSACCPRHHISNDMCNRERKTYRFVVT